MADITKYGGSAGEDFPDARRDIDSGKAYTGPHDASALLYGDPENPENSAPGTPGEDRPPQSGASRVQDILDETTRITDNGKTQLSGQHIVTHMSPIAPYCLDTNQMTLLDESSGEGWTFVSVAPGPYFIGNGLISIGKQSVSSVYVDPDQDQLSSLDNLAQYWHSGVDDPELIEEFSGDPYGNALYAAPVYNYQEREKTALYNKFGYEAVVGPMDAYGATMYRLGAEIDNIIEMLQTGYSERKNISRSTPGINIFDNFETITAVENEEVVESTDSIMSTSTMSSTPASPGNDGGNSYE